MSYDTTIVLLGLISAIVFIIICIIRGCKGTLFYRIKLMLPSVNRKFTLTLHPLTDYNP